MTDHDKELRNYQATTIIFSKPLYYGGRNFIKYNTRTKKFYVGNTASTAVNTSAPIYIEDVTTKMVKQIAKQLLHLGYVEYVNNWKKGVDTYGNIRKAGLN